MAATALMISWALKMLRGGHFPARSFSTAKRVGPGLLGETRKLENIGEIKWQ